MGRTYFVISLLTANAVLCGSALAASKSAKVSAAIEGPIEPVCVVKSGANLRRGPGAKFPVTWTVPRYMPLLKVANHGPWLKVQDLEGESHWIAKSAISKKLTCAVVKTKTAKLREGPGVEHPLAGLSSVDRYTPFQKIDRDGEWVQVKDDYGAKYWVHETNVWIPVSRTHISF